MDAEWLASQLGAGRSIESIAREVGRSPSTVAYWVEQARPHVHPRAQARSPRRHRPRALEALVAAGLLDPRDRGATRRELHDGAALAHDRYGLTTPRPAGSREQRPRRGRRCRTRASATARSTGAVHVRAARAAGFRCRRCRSRGGEPSSARDQGDPGRRSGRRVRALRLRRLRRCPAVPSRRSGDQGVRVGRRRDHALARRARAPRRPSACCCARTVMPRSRRRR